MSRVLVTDKYRHIPGETVLYDIAADQTGWAADGTLTAAVDTSVKMPGKSQSVKLTVDSAATLGYYTISSLSLDLSQYRSLGVWIYFPDRADKSNLYVEFLAVTAWGANLFEASTKLSGDVLYKGWIFVGWDMLSTGSGDGSKDQFLKAGAADWSNITQLRVRVRSANGTANSVYVDSIVAGRRSKAAISFCFDDSNASDYTAYQNLAAYGWSGSSFLYSATFDDGNPAHLQQAEADIMYAAGWEMCNHTSSALPATTLGSVEAITAAVQGGYDNLITYGYTKDADILAYVGGDFDANMATVVDTLDIVQYGRLFQAVGSPMYIAGHPDGEGANEIGFDRYNMATYELQSNTKTLNDLKAAVDEVIARGGWQIFSGHKIVSGAAGALEIQDTIWADLLAYIETKESAGLVDVLTIGQVMKGPITRLTTDRATV